MQPPNQLGSTGMPFDVKSLIQPAVTVGCCIATLILTLSIYSCTNGKEQTQKLSSVETNIGNLSQKLAGVKSDLKTDLKAQEDRLTTQITKVGQEQSIALTDLKTETTAIVNDLKQSLNQTSQKFSSEIEGILSSASDLKSTIADLRTEAEVTKTKLQDAVDKINSSPIKDLREVASQFQSATDRLTSVPTARGFTAYIQLTLQHVEGNFTREGFVTVESYFKP
jgi:archaellum component FlaC